MITIKQVSSENILHIRQEVLRPGKPLIDCIFESDDLETTLHFGLFDHQFLRGIVSVYEKKSKFSNHELQFQIRGMAVLGHCRQLGYGKILLTAVENHLKIYKNVFIWFNARATAITFYEKLGYIQYGSMFEISGVGNHVLMFKYQD